MSDHKQNLRASLHASLPDLLPPGYRARIDIQLQVMPAADLLLVPTDKMRDVDGKIEVMGPDGLWVTPPDGVETHELGKSLDPDQCDVAVLLGTVVEDMAGPKLIFDGQAPRGKTSSGPVAIIARMPLLQWWERHGVR